jgi:hypothetical protein
MEPSRIRTLLIGLAAGVVYAFLAMLLITANHKNVSVAYIFILPLILGAIPVLFSTKEQLHSYKMYLLLLWGIVMTFFFLCFISGFEGMICLVIIIGPFLLLGSLGAFIFRLIRLKYNGKGTKLYASLTLPFLVLLIETNFQASDQFHSVKTSIEINAGNRLVWENIKNVRNIRPAEINRHFIHLIGIPKPLNGQLDKEGVGGVRSITWEKGIRFKEKIKTWNEGHGFAYDIDVDPESIPPTTLDEHVMIGGSYFDVVEGSYQLDRANEHKQVVTLTCKYRVTTSLNLYSKWWADLVLNDFNETILEVIKKRCERTPELTTTHLQTLSKIALPAAERDTTNKIHN